MFLQVFVILFTGGVCLSACWDMHLHQEQTPPWGADTPQGADTHPRSTEPPGAVHARRYGQQAGGTHPTGMQSCSVYCFSDAICPDFLNLLNVPPPLPAMYERADVSSMPYSQAALLCESMPLWGSARGRGGLGRVGDGCQITFSSFSQLQPGKAVRYMVMKKWIVQKLDYLTIWTIALPHEVTYLINLGICARNLIPGFSCPYSSIFVIILIMVIPFQFYQFVWIISVTFEPKWFAGTLTNLRSMLLQ